MFDKSKNCTQLKISKSFSIKKTSSFLYVHTVNISYFTVIFGYNQNLVLKVYIVCIFSRQGSVHNKYLLTHSPYISYNSPVNKSIL